jgi:hypothetical protein
VTARVVDLAVGRPSAAYGAQLGDVTQYAVKATQHVRELADQLAAGYVQLWGTAATRDAAVRAIRDAREALRGDAPSLFVLSFTGHGGHIADRDGDEVIDHEDEAWALDDAPLIDDEIMVLLREFPDNINIAVLSNCCFGGGIDVLGTRGSALEDMLAELDAPERIAILEPLLAARRRVWYDAVARLGQDRLYAPLATTVAQAPRARGSSPPRALPQARGEQLESPLRKWVLAAVCQPDQTFFATSNSVFSSTILDTVFPSSDGARHRAPGATYHVLRDALAHIPGLPLFAIPTVTGPEAVLRGLAFVPT